MISAHVVADSINQFGNRITTMMVVMPRYILAEFNTHRAFSRNSASSRAIPFKRMVKMVEDNPFIPIAWQKDHTGMQGTEYFTDKSDIAQQELAWLRARDYAIQQSEQLNINKVTKQLANRLLEPFMYHQVLITATEFENFFALRAPQYGGNDGRGKEIYFRSKKDAIKHLENIGVNTSNLSLDDTLGWFKINKGQAEIHMMALAEAMWDAMNKSTPKQLKPGEWHIPFGDQIDYHKLNEITTEICLKDKPVATDEEYHKTFDSLMIKIATARCARLSYMTLGDNPKIDYEADIKLHDNLLASGHMSPFEHCARAMDDHEWNTLLRGEFIWDSKGGYIPKGDVSYGWSGNFNGFVQYRKMIPNENITL